MANGKMFIQMTQFAPNHTFWSTNRHVSACKNSTTVAFASSDANNNIDGGGGVDMTMIGQFLSDLQDLYDLETDNGDDK